MIYRYIEKQILDKFYKGKAILLLGPRQSGKSTLIQNILSKQKEQFIEFNGDETDVRKLLTNISSTQLKQIIGSNKIIFIDEAQRIENIGLTIKLITDQIRNVQVIASGSSSFELANKINEPLTGRKYEFLLLPLAYSELKNHQGFLEEQRLLEHRMIYGYYPEVVSKPNEEKELLQLLADSYLYKDLFVLDQIKKSSLLSKIVRALALQIGSEISYNEIAQLVGANKQTVEKYIRLLEQAFVVFHLSSYSRNIRNELKKRKKIYFYDLGIRNAVIGNFNNLSSRTDVGALWENYLIAERVKYLAYTQSYAHKFFWRTTQQQEIDYIEEHIVNEPLAYEFKWNPNSKAKFSKTFTENYKPKITKVIHRENYDEFINLEF